jgi:hypothetical protein
MMSKKWGLFVGLFFLMSMMAHTQGQAMIGDIDWSDSIAVVNSKLHSTFGNAELDTEADISKAHGLVMGQAAYIEAHFRLDRLYKITLTFTTQADPQMALPAHQQMVLMLQEIYLIPAVVNLLTGERRWLLSDGAEVWHTQSYAMAPVIHKTKGTIKGEGHIKGRNVRLFTQNEVYEGNWTLDLGGEGLEVELEEEHEQLVVTTVVTLMGAKISEEDQEMMEGQDQTMVDEIVEQEGLEAEASEAVALIIPAN